MTAQRVVRLVVGTGRGESRVESFTEDDTAMQLRATEDLSDLLGLKPSKTAGSLTGGGPMTVNVSFAPAPAPIEIIELPRN